MRDGSQVYTYTDVRGGGSKSSTSLDMVDLNSSPVKYWSRVSTMTSKHRMIDMTNVVWVSDVPHRDDIGMDYI